MYTCTYSTCCAAGEVAEMGLLGFLGLPDFDKIFFSFLLIQSIYRLRVSNAMDMPTNSQKEIQKRICFMHGDDCCIKYSKYRCCFLCGEGSFCCTVNGSEPSVDAGALVNLKILSWNSKAGNNV